jgi:NAD(P)-dependent dehydrogenase (short-subunit alcohol dehydrogenase family)
MAGRLEGRVGLITGGAGSIGAASARAMVREGARVVLADLRAERLAEVVDELGADRAAAVEVDVTESAAIKLAVQLAVDRFGGLDIVFANAGVFGEVASIVDYPEDAFDRVMAVNVRGVFLTCKHGLAAMREGGSLILNSSVVGLTSDPGICGYATSKHAVVGLMRTAMKEAAPRGIRVNSIHPGPVDNEFQHRIEVTATGESAQRAAELFEQNIPLGRHATPQEIAETVVFLAGRESGFVTGAAIAVDGGMSV